MPQTYKDVDTNTKQTFNTVSLAAKDDLSRRDTEYWTRVLSDTIEAINQHSIQEVNYDQNTCSLSWAHDIPVGLHMRVDTVKLCCVVSRAVLSLNWVDVWSTFGGRRTSRTASALQHRGAEDWKPVRTLHNCRTRPFIFFIWRQNRLKITGALFTQVALVLNIYCK